MRVYDLMGYPNYDWVDNSCTRTPEEYRYSYSSHYVWRDFDKTNVPDNVFVVYSDRMSQHDYEKYNRVVAGVGWIENIDKKTAKRIIKDYYGGKYACVGFARSCNQSTGYGIGMFFVKENDEN